MWWLIGATAAVVLGAPAVYAGFCWLDPYQPCRWCNGLPATGLGRRNIKMCRWCRGTGVRLRLGRRAYNHAAGLRRAAQPRG